MNTHACLKCKTQYEDEEVDAYYCTTCLVEKKRIADEIDAKIAMRPRKETKSAMQQYDEQAVNVRGIKLLKVSL